MIETRDDIKYLLDSYLEEDYYIQFSEVDREAINGGIVLKKYRNAHPQTIATLKMGVTDDALRHEITQWYKWKQRTNDLYVESNKSISNMNYQEIQQRPIQELIGKYTSFNALRYVIEPPVLPIPEFRVLVYLCYAFDNYRYYDKYRGEVSVLETIYSTHLDKYNLISIDSNRELLSIDPPRIYDKQIKRTFLTKNVPVSLCKILKETQSIGMLSIRLRNSTGLIGKFEKEPKKRINEGLIGKPFNITSTLNNISVNMLYSDDCYQEQLWVKVDKSNITFEELYEEPDLICNDAIIVTQVLHCEYIKNENNDHYITHLDHEYIFYTEDEYNIRKSNPYQKGNACKRMKNFKIDDSKIKFNCQFLYDVLMCYFRHTERIQEYFQNALDKTDSST